MSKIETQKIIQILVKMGISLREQAYRIMSAIGYTDAQIETVLKPEETVTPNPPAPTEPVTPGPPTPTEPSDPGPPVPAGPQDEVDLSLIRWMDAPDAAEWPIVADIEVTITGDRVLVAPAPPWTQTADVSGKQLAGNFWIGLWNGSQYEMHPYEWFFPRQNWCSKNIWHIPGHLCHGRTVNSPTPGQEVLYMVSTCARCGVRSGNQRSNIKKIMWR
jgi:hypothetical protein